MNTRLPPVSFSIGNPEINYGQIENIFFTEIGYPLASLQRDEIMSRINDSSTDDGKIRKMHVIGSKAEPERSSIDLSLGRKVYGEGSHTVAFKIDETNNINYQMLKSIEKNPGATYLFWFSSGNYFYGGKSGIEASIILSEVISESRDELVVFNGAITWKGSSADRNNLNGVNLGIDNQNLGIDNQNLGII